MNDLVRFARSVEYATGKKRGRHPVFNSNMFYPYKEELQLQQATKKQFERFIAEAYEAAISGEAFAFTDDLNALSNLPEELPDSFKSEVSAIGRAIGQKVSNVIANSSEMIVGKPYYPPAAKDEIFKTWEANFDMLCKSAESDIKKDISRIVLQAKNEGWNGKQVEKAVRSELPEKYKNRAEVIARTEAAKLNTQATMSTYKEIGCQYYMWMATLDERVRPDHAMMNGIICSVDDPEVYYDETPEGLVEKKRDGTMVHLHPGEDFQCRCTMVMWDPAIDGKYEVKEKPAEEKSEEPEQRTENGPASRELEKANERLAQQKKELERAKNEAKTAEKQLSKEKTARMEAERAAKEERRKKEILLNSDRRHRGRTEKQVEKIQEKWNIHNVKRAGVIETEYSLKDTKLIKTEEDLQAVIDRYIAKFPSETQYSRINIQTFNEPPTRYGYAAMSASHYSEVISFNKAKSNLTGGGESAFKNLISAFQKIQRGKKLSFDEEYALECFYHEVMHSKTKGWSQLKQHGQGDFKRTSMETINQFVSRHDYGTFIRNMGGRAYNQSVVLDNGGGYRNWVRTLRDFIRSKKLDEVKVLAEFRDKLLNGRYDELDSVLYDFFKRNSGTKKSLDEVLSAFEKSRDSNGFIAFLSSSSQ